MSEKIVKKDNKKSTSDSSHKRVQTAEGKKRQLVKQLKTEKTKVV